jgi:hypothetical protein
LIVRGAADTVSVIMRTKPVRRDEVRSDGAHHITTLPFGSVRKSRDKWGDAFLETNS